MGILFGHPNQHRKCFACSPETGISDNETLKLFDEVESWSKICLKYKQSTLKPIVGFSLSKEFNNEISAGFKQTIIIALGVIEGEFNDRLLIELSNLTLFWKQKLLNHHGQMG